MWLLGTCGLLPKMAPNPPVLGLAPLQYDFATPLVRRWSHFSTPGSPDQFCAPLWPVECSVNVIAELRAKRFHSAHSCSLSRNECWLRNKLSWSWEATWNRNKPCGRGALGYTRPIRQALGWGHHRPPSPPPDRGTQLRGLHQPKSQGAHCQHQCTWFFLSTIKL